MSDEPLVYGLYEMHGASADVNLTAISIVHDYFVARDDEHAQMIGREKAGLLAFRVVRLMDVRVA